MESVADIILMGFLIGILMNVRSKDLKSTIDAACSMEAIGEESLEWMSRCVSKAIITGINSNDYIRDVSSLVPIKQTELKYRSKMTKEASQFRQHLLANWQAKYISELLTKQEMNKLISCQEDEILLHLTNVTMDALKGKIEQMIHEKIALGELHRLLCSVYSNVISPSRSDLEQFLDCICNLTKFSTVSSQLSDADFQTDELQSIALELMSKPRNGGITATDLESYTHEITTAAAEIEIGTVITKFSEFIWHNINMFSSKTKAGGYVCDDVQMFEAPNKALISTCSEIIRGMLQNRITRSVMFDIQKKTKEFKSKHMLSLIDFGKKFLVHDHVFFKLSKRKHKAQDLSNRLKEYNNQMKKSGGSHVKTDATLFSGLELNMTILDVDKEVILTISSRDIHKGIELIYNPPCHVYPGGHFNAYIERKVKVVKASDEGDYYLLNSAMKVACGSFSWSLYGSVDKYIDEYPLVAGMLLTIDGYACQLKRGRALLRLYMNSPTRQTNQCEEVELDVSHLSSSTIKQALQSEKVSQLAKVLAEYESESRFR